MPAVAIVVDAVITSTVADAVATVVTNTVIADIATAAITNAIGSAAQAAATGGNIWQAAEKGFVSGGLSAGVSDVAQPLLQEAGLSADAAKALADAAQLQIGPGGSVCGAALL